MRKTMSIIIITILAITAIGYLMKSDAEIDMSQERLYCQMVTLWQEDTEKGVPTHQRRGWPPYRGQDFCK